MTSSQIYKVPQISKKKSLVMVGYMNANYKRKGFREQEGHPAFGRIRTIRLFDNTQGILIPNARKVRITIEEITK